MEDSEQVSDLDDPLAELYEAVRDGATVEVVDLKGTDQLNVNFGERVTVSPEEHDMKAALVEHRDVLLEMVGSDEGRWPDVLDEYGVEGEERREQLRTFAESARE